MQAWFERSVPGRALRAAGDAPVGLLSRLLPRRDAAEGILRPYQRFLMVGFALMFCCPHGYWNNLFGVGFAALALLVYWMDCAGRGITPQNPAKLGPGLWLFLLMCFLCTLWAEYKAASLRVALFYAAGAALLYVSSAAFREKKAFDAMMLFLLAALIVSSVYGLIDYALHDQAYGVPLGGRIVDRLCSTLEHAINYSEFVAMSFPLCLVWLLQRHGKRKWWALLLLLPALALLLTYARTGWIALAFAVFLLAVFYSKKLLLPLILLGFAGFFVLPDSLRERFLSMLQFSDTASSGRFTLWRECFAMLREHWLFGLGLGQENFFHAYLPHCTGTLAFSPPHANMGYLEIFLSTGILGFLGFLLFFFGIFPRLRRARRRLSLRQEQWPLWALTASLAGAALANLPEHIWFYPRVFWGWCLVYALALSRLGED